MNPIPFFDLARQNELLKPQLDAVWERTVQSHEFILGKELDLFEKNFAAFCGTRFCVGTSSGLDALTLTLRALEFEEGSEVLVPANTFIATALAVSLAGLTPIFCDVDPETLLMDVANLRKTKTAKTRAVIPVHLYGQVCEMEPILEYCRKEKILVIEDACQAHGASAPGGRAGSFGEAACFSFFPSKNLGAFGDGGAVTTSNQALYQKLKLLRNYGSEVKYHHEVQGANMRLDTLQAGILNVKLPYLDEWNQKRSELAARYRAGLEGLPAVKLLPDRPGYSSAWHLYAVSVPCRDELKKNLESRQIYTGIHYPIPVHLQGAYRRDTYRAGDFPVSEKAAGELLSLPMFPELSPEEVDRVTALMRELVSA